MRRKAKKEIEWVGNRWLMDVAQCIAKLIVKLTLIYIVQIFSLVFSFFLFLRGFLYYPSHLHECVPMCFKWPVTWQKVCSVCRCIYGWRYILYYIASFFSLPPNTTPDLCWKLVQFQDTYILQGIFWYLSLLRIVWRKYAFILFFIFFLTCIMVVVIFVIKLI